MLTFYAVFTLIFAAAFAKASWKGRGPAGLLFLSFTTLASISPIIFSAVLNVVKYEELSLFRHTSDVIIARLVLTGVASTAIGYILAPTRSVNRIKRMQRATNKVEQVLNQARIMTFPLELMSAALSIIIVTLILVQPGGLTGFIRSNLERVPTENAFSSAIYVCAVFYCYLVCALLICSAVRSRKLPKFHMLASALLFWGQGGRVQFAAVLITFALVMIRYERLRSFRAVLLAVPALAAMNAILIFRLLLQGGAKSGNATTLGSTVDQLSMIGTYDLAIQYVHRFGNQWFLYLDMILQLIPRAVYPSKPLQISKIFREVFFGDSLGGIPPGLWGEFYIIGGTVGVLILGTLFGMLLKFLDLSIRTAAGRSAPMQTLVFSLVPVLGIFAPRGGFDNSIFRIAVILASTAFLVLTARFLSAPSAPDISRTTALRRSSVPTDLDKLAHGYSSR